MEYRLSSHSSRVESSKLRKMQHAHSGTSGSIRSRIDFYFAATFTMIGALCASVLEDMEKRLGRLSEQDGGNLWRDSVIIFSDTMQAMLAYITVRTEGGIPRAPPAPCARAPHAHPFMIQCLP